MQYHAHALAASGVDVDLVGYKGTPLSRSSSQTIRASRSTGSTSPVAHPASRRSKIVYGVLAVVDALRASVRLWRTDAALPRPDLLLVQNPPAFPTLQVAWLVVAPRGARLVIDWHNLGYTILALRLGRRHPAVRLARWLEQHTARRAHAHLCVSRGFARFSRTASRSEMSTCSTTGRRPRSFRSSATEREQIPSGAVRAAGIVGQAPSGSSCARRAGPRTRTSTSSSKPSSGSRIASAGGRPATEPAVHGSRDPGDRRRQPPRGVRAAVRRPSGAARAAAHALARARGLSAHRGQRRPGAVPAPFVVGHGHPDEGRRPVRRRRAGHARSTTARAWPSACATATTACCSPTPRQLAELLFDLFETFPASTTSLERLRTGARRSAHPTWEEGWRATRSPS